MELVRTSCNMLPGNMSAIRKMAGLYGVSNSAIINALISHSLESGVDPLGYIRDYYEGSNNSRAQRFRARELSAQKVGF